MTEREQKLVKWAIAQTRHELGDRVAPGPQDSQWRAVGGRPGVTDEDAHEIRGLARNYVSGEAN